MISLDALSEQGQSIWYDYIRRSMLVDGELSALVGRGLRGVTSNPAIFEKAIAGSSDYDEAIKRFAGQGMSDGEVYEALAVADIQTAADLLLPVYTATEARDGFVSLEVNPDLANDTEGTVSEARRLYGAVGRPNVMIKVPATRAGIPAIAALIGAGVNVNVTLIFGIENYRAVAGAFLAGLKQLAASGPAVDGGHGVDRVASVASFFVSRVDTAVDRDLADIGNTELQGKIAVANARLAYREFLEIFSGPEWEALSAQGAGLQRVLWASTGTKNPTYPDTLYVDELIGPNTVNTLPPKTLEAFLDHGRIGPTLTEGVEEAGKQVDMLAGLGIDLEAITERLQAEGVEAFARPFASLLKRIAQKRADLEYLQDSYAAEIGPYGKAVEAALSGLRDEKVIERIWAHDHTVWKEAPDEITNRLGWLHSPENMAGAVGEIHDLVEAVRSAGYTDALLLGMGGSSLAPEVFRKTFGVADGFLDLAVLDSTDPGAVLARRRKIDPARTLFVVSTKSGGTVETFSFMKYFYNETLSIVGPDAVGAHFVAITDPGSGLETTARQLGFRKIFLNDPDIGGRYSALSYFGLVPAALIGIHIDRVIDRAGAMAGNGGPGNCPVAGDNTAARLGAVLGEMALAGRDKVSLVTSPKIKYFGAWVEQLIAESTGKEGRGILPVDGETLGNPEVYGPDRIFVHLRLDGDTSADGPVETLHAAGHPVVRLRLRDLYDLSGEFFRWEMATVIAGRRLGINPFDQPNVESAKVLAKQMVAAYDKEGRLPALKPDFSAGGIRVYAGSGADSLEAALREFLSRAAAGDREGAERSYVAIQAYITPGPEVDGALARLRERIRTDFRLAVTVGYGPRFLHSTGQLHKGDAGNGLFIQITGDTAEDVPIPDGPGETRSSISFGVLKDAQALGDRQALIDAGRSVIRFHVTGPMVPGIDRLTQGIG